MRAEADAKCCRRTRQPVGCAVERSTVIQELGMEFIPRGERGRTLVGRVRSLLLALGHFSHQRGGLVLVGRTGSSLREIFPLKGTCLSGSGAFPFFYALFFAPEARRRRIRGACEDVSEFLPSMLFVWPVSATFGRATHPDILHLTTGRMHVPPYADPYAPMPDAGCARSAASRISGIVLWRVGAPRCIGPLTDLQRNA